MRCFLFCWVLVLAPWTVNAQSDSTRDAHKLKVIALPGVFSSPETSVGFGALGIGTFRFRGEPDSSRASQVSIGLSYTLLDQVLVYVPYQLFWSHEKYKLYGELGWYRYVYSYYGIGPQHGNETREDYDVTYPRVRVNLLRRAGRSTYVGVRYWLDDRTDLHYDPIGGLYDGTIVGKAGGITSGIGPVVNLDTRDNIFLPFSGVLAEASVLVNDDALGSDHAFVQTSVEVSGFIPLRRISISPGDQRLNQPVLGLNLLATATDGDVPFYALGLLGGAKHMRGYYEGFFRDKRMIEGQAELRWPLFNRWRGNWKRFGVAGFGGLGSVAPSVKALALDDAVYTYGAGLRILLDRKQGINLRVDYARGTGTSGFYLTIGEAF
ncbi:MAG: BamA/TamA family outer membrane protein [Flavobacteriales bacterium]